MAKNSTLFSNNEAWNDGRMESRQVGATFQPSILSPGDAVINRILSFSQALQIKKSRDAGLIEIVLN